MVKKDDGSVVIDPNRKPTHKKTEKPLNNGLSMKREEKKTSEDEDEDAKEKRLKLMENMAQRWLQQEVSHGVRLITTWKVPARKVLRTQLMALILSGD